MTKNKTYTKAAQAMNPTATPQDQPIPGKNMVPNNAGGYAFQVDEWTQLERFLILGSEGGTYYVGESKLTLDNAKNVSKCIAANGSKTVDTIVKISDSGRAAKNDPALFALAMCASADDVATRRYALNNLSKVARIGTHLFHFVEYVNKLRGWSRGLRSAVSNWYLDRDIKSLEMQLAKYQGRDGWRHRDVIRLAHPIPTTPAQTLAFKWAVDVYHAQNDVGSNRYNVEQYEADKRLLAEQLPFINAYEQVKVATTDSEVVRLVRDYKLPLELVPTEKRTKNVYNEIIPNLGITALIRQLPTLTRADVLGHIGSDNTKYVIEKITSLEDLKKGRVHPMQMLLALITYRSGRSFKGSSTWMPIQRISAALEDGFYLSFGAVTPTNKSLMLALDISSSMGWGPAVGSEQLTPRDIAAVMSMVTARVEKDWMIMGFAHNFRPLNITSKMDLMSVINETERQGFGGTDCAIPMNHATQHKIPVDAFVIYTDSETWAGRTNHPIQALKTYQQKMGRPAKLITVAAAATHVTIADDSQYTLNVHGFDTAAPNIISDFITH